VTGQIAWVRLLIYSGASILLLVESYRFILLSMSFFFIAPLLIAIIQWGFLLGFGLFTIGIYKLYKSSPPLLDQNEYSRVQMKSILIISLGLSILIGMLAVIPPEEYIQEDIKAIFSIFISILWSIFYFSLCLWIISYWKLTTKNKSILFIKNDKKKLLHLSLGMFVSVFWFTNLLFWIFLGNSVFSIDFLNLLYVIVLTLFLFNQIILFFNVRKFSFLIYG